MAIAGGLVSFFTFFGSMKEIGAEEFAGSEDLTSVTIPDGVKEIGNDAFPYGTKEILRCPGPTRAVSCARVHIETHLKSCKR